MRKERDCFHTPPKFFPSSFPGVQTQTPQKMAGAQMKAKLLKAQEEERVRKAVLDLHRAGGLSLNAIAQHPSVKKSKATVQSIIDRFEDREIVQTVHKGGRKTTLTVRYHPSFRLSHFHVVFFLPSCSSMTYGVLPI